MLTLKECLQKIKNVEGVAQLVEWLKSTDFLTAPASTKYHGTKSGDLVRHSVRVAENLVRLSSLLEYKWKRPESPYLIGLFHDLCKVNFYQGVTKWKKNEENKWESYEAFEVNDQEPLGHGEKSIIILQRFIKLTDEELFCIRFHMGAYVESDKYYLDKAILKYPIVMLVCLADQTAGVFETLQEKGVVLDGNALKILVGGSNDQNV